jgi:hypothetical protein
MKRKSLIITSAFLIFIFLLIALGVSMAQKDKLPKTAESYIKVKVETSKEIYSQGEIVSLNFVVSNTETSDTYLKGASADSGYLWVYIASPNEGFKRYYWGGVKKKTKGFYVKGGQSITSQATLLWNSKPNPEEVGQAYIQDRITTDYAFPEPGTYLIKAKLLIPREKPIEIESEPIQIIISEPTGDDLQVWNLIKDRGDIAYFIQQGEPKTYKESEKGKLLTDIEKITTDYPNSFLGTQIKQSLEEFRTDEKKIKESRQQIQKNKEKP